MSNLDVYCISHYNDKDVFVNIGELGMLLDHKDFATNGYVVDKVQHPKTTSKFGGKKGKVLV